MAEVRRLLRYIVNPNGPVEARQKAQESLTKIVSTIDESKSGKLYPNPTKDVLNIDLGDEYKDYQMTVVDVPE
jgi:hypothetical protein